MRIDAVCPDDLVSEKLAQDDRRERKISVEPLFSYNIDNFFLKKKTFTSTSSCLSFSTQDQDRKSSYSEAEPFFPMVFMPANKF